MSALNRWAVDVLKGLRIEPNRSNVRLLVGWANAEGGHFHNTAKFNPLNTTLNLPGSGDTGTQGNISVYKDWRQGVEATVKTLRDTRVAGKDAYRGIRRALRTGSADEFVAAIGNSPWGTSSELVAKTVGATPRSPVPSKGIVTGTLSTRLRKQASVQGASAAGFDPGSPSSAAAPLPEPTPPPESLVPAGGGIQAPTDARQSLALPAGYQAPASGGGPAPAPSVLDLLPEPQAVELPQQAEAPSSKSLAGKIRAGAGKPTTNGRSGHVKGELYELIWRGQGSQTVKNGGRVGRDFYEHHEDHVHVAARQKDLLVIGKIAQDMGLHVGENPAFGGVTPVHVGGSFHYGRHEKKGENDRAIDVNGGSAAQYAKFARRVARLYGL